MEQLLVEVHDQLPAWEFDLLCTTGGAPLFSRADGLVLPGTSHLEVHVRIDPTYTGFQVGYVLDTSPAEHEADQENITWLEAVAPGGEQTFRIPVTQEQVELPGGGHLWAFYGRVNPGADEACYTGAGAGGLDIVITAIRAGA